MSRDSSVAQMFPKPQWEGLPQWPQSHDPIGRAIDQVCAIFFIIIVEGVRSKVVFHPHPYNEFDARKLGKNRQPSTWASGIRYERIFY